MKRNNMKQSTHEKRIVKRKTRSTPRTPKMKLKKISSEISSPRDINFSTGLKTQTSQSTNIAKRRLSRKVANLTRSTPSLSVSSRNNDEDIVSQKKTSVSRSKTKTKHLPNVAVNGTRKQRKSMAKTSAKRKYGQDIPIPKVMKVYPVTPYREVNTSLSDVVYTTGTGSGSELVYTSINSSSHLKTLVLLIGAPICFIIGAFIASIT